MANATSAATNMTISSTSKAFKELGDKVGITPESFLDQFIYYADLQTADNPNIVFKVDRIFVNINK